MRNVSRWGWLIALVLVACDDGTNQGTVDAGRLDATLNDPDAAVDDMARPDQAVDAQVIDAQVVDQGPDAALDAMAPDHQLVDMAPPSDMAVDQGPPDPDMARAADMAPAPDMAPDPDQGVVCVPDEACATGLAGVCAAGVTACPDGPDGAATCAPVDLARPEQCDGLDNDCDGSADEALVMGCYDGPGDTAGRGACREGQRRCVDGAFGACEGAIVPVPEACDGVDSDCDGAVDEGADGQPITAPCYGGPAGTEDTGVCRGGVRTCMQGGFGVCEGEVLPGVEICDSLDNDCNGGVDDVAVGGCDCVGGTEQACATVPDAQRGVGRCADGVQRCRDDGAGFGICQGEIGPQAERCDGIDDDCDGTVDEAVAGVGEACQVGVGACARAGARICDPAGGVRCDAAPGDPVAEICDGLDNDCDGATDEGLGLGGACAAGEGACQANGQRACGPDGAVICDAQPAAPGVEACNGVDDDCDGTTDEDLGLGEACVAGQGICQADGVLVCNAGGEVICQADLNPAGPEVCDDQDNDCDGDVDEGWRVGEACGAGIGACRGEGERICDGNGAVRCSAVPNPPGPEACNAIDDDCDGRTDERLGLGEACQAGAGACQVEGVNVCGPDGAVVCEGEVGEGGAESCNGVDDDCDGQTDEDFGVGEACEDGVGACRAFGALACNADGEVVCDAPVGMPGAESCNAQDDDCDGTIDEGFGLGDRCVAGAGQCQVEGVFICGNDGQRTCSAQPGDLSDETCNGVDDDCDGSVDEGLGLGAACSAGQGACRADGEVICDAAGGTRCSVEDRAPVAETCNAFDDDCDGQIDEGFGVGDACADGIGACRNEGEIVCTDEGGAACSVQAGRAAAELCNDIDDDCDGSVDERFIVGQACSVGVGACRADGVRVCSGDFTTDCDAEAGAPAAETCDAQDNDCDGTTDEGLGLGEACTVGLGECAADGQRICDGQGGVTCDVEPGAPVAEACDTLDNDCDGSADEGIGLGAACTVGVGQCASDGTQICDGQGGVTCDAEPGRARAEQCNGLDDDCDGESDETFAVGEPCTIGEGICESAGNLICGEGGAIVCDAQPIDNGADEQCNGSDDDCDGSVDEGTGIGAPCSDGIGACRRDGVTQCDAQGGLACSVVAAPPGEEACNGLDDDCDGAADEGDACVDVTGPDVVIAHPGEVNIGDEVVITVILDDDFDPAPIARLSIDGVMVQLDAQNTYRFIADEAGVLLLEAEGEDEAGNIGRGEARMRVSDPGDVDPPFVRLTAPADGTELAGTTALRGTLLDDNFDYYEVDISPDRQTWLTIGGGTNAGEDVPVGALDPTILPPGYVFVRLTGYDVNGRSAFQIITVFVPETASVGDTRITIRDFQMPLKGFPITLDRSYDSRRKLERGDFGHGWFLGRVDVAIVEDLQSNVMVVLPDGDRKVFAIRYEFSPFFPVGTYDYVAPAGSGATLEGVQSCAVVNSQVGPVCFDTGRPVADTTSTYRLTTRDGTVWVIDQTAGLQSATDPEGNQIEYLQDAIRSTLGPQILLERDGSGRIVRMTDPRGGEVTYEYDGAGDLVRVIDQVGGEQIYRYDDAHTLAEILGPDGNPMIRSEYDDEGRKTVDIDALGHRTEYAYDLEGGERTVTDRRGGVTRYVYDEIGQVTERVGPGGGITRFGYNANGQLITESIAPSQSFDYAYDAAGNQREVTDQRGVRHQFGWQQGRLIEAIDGLGNRIQIARDAEGRPTEITNAAGGTVTVAYDADGNRESITDAMGGVHRFTYDPLGNIEGMEGPAGFTRSYAYDAAANLTSMRDSAGELYRFEYDAVGRLTRVIPPDDAAVGLTRDGLGRLTQVTDADGAIWQLGYSPRGELISATDPNGARTEYVYDAAGALTEARYPNGDVVQYRITIDGFNAERTDPLGNTSRFEFSPEGAVLARVDRNATRIEFAYNESGDIERRAVIGGPVDTYEYDLGDRLVRTARDGLEWTFEYDPDDRLTRERGPHAEMSYAYDLAGRRTRMTGPDGDTDYEYDARARLAAVTAPGAGRVEFERDGEGRVTRTRLPNGVEVTYSYDRVGRPLGFSTTGGDVDVQEVLEVDPTGRPLSITSEDDGVISLDYDAAGQLIRFTRVGGEAPDLDIAYRYDARGTRSGITVDGAAVEHEIDADARILTDAHAVSRYDAAGNTIERTLPGLGVVQHLQFDSERHLVRVDRIADGEADQVVAYDYDPLGRRHRRTVDATESFEVIESGELTWRLDDQGALLERFVHGDRTDELVAYVTPEGALYPVLDTRGNVAAVFDAAGSLVARYQYDPDGNRVMRDGDVALPVGFGARPIEPVSGLYDFRARAYAPDSGRFLQQDPESGVRARAITQHPYAYANNDPYSFRDPSGRAAAISYAFLSSRFVTGSAGVDSPNHYELAGAMIGFFHGFGATAIVFLANILEVANSGGNVLDQWGAAMAATEAKMDEIAATLGRFSALKDNGFSGAFVNGAKFKVGIKFTVKFVPDPVNRAVRLGTGEKVNQVKFIGVEKGAGGFKSGVKEALNFIGLHGPR